jgi:hypothetical protein
MLLFPKNVHAQHYYASKGKMKVKKTANKSMMSNLVWVKRKNFPIAAMSSFCHRNPKYIFGEGATMNMLEFDEKIHDNDVKLKKV